MPRDGRATRTRILDAAETLALLQGFSSTSIDSVIVKAGITKGSFFYHFKSKADLATALVERYAERDAAHLEANLDRAERLARTPLEQVLVFVGLFQEEAEALAQPAPGCLFAAFCYEAELHDDRTKATVVAAFEHWRRRVGAKLASVIERHPPRHAVTATGLVDMLLALFEGAFILSRTLRDPKMVAAQLGHFRAYLTLLFAPAEAEIPRPSAAPAVALPVA